MFGFDLMVLVRNVFRGGHTKRDTQRRVANTRLLLAREAAVLFKCTHTHSGQWLSKEVLFKCIPIIIVVYYTGQAPTIWHL